MFAKGIIFSFGTHTILGPFMLVFLQDLFLKVPVEIGCTMEELDDVLLHNLFLSYHETP